MTGRDIEVDVRQILGDTGSTKKWSPDTIIIFINQATKEITNRWSDACIKTDGSYLTTVVPIEAMADELSITDYWKQRVTDYVASKCYEVKASGKENRERADIYWNKFIKRD
ncbi:unnamed protein product [marine sediment metagenome]|uniref:Uncharacterized protein n=1 Tax=marine sediment metagenome TaxID=412755 RepID=X0SQV7_9ZZZZ